MMKLLNTENSVEGKTENISLVLENQQARDSALVSVSKIKTTVLAAP
jgi:hypothetical protein